MTASNATVHGDGLPTVGADSTQLRRVLQNLIENGIKYAAPEIKELGWQHANEPSRGLAARFA